MSKAKILVLDIETAPLLSYHWGLFDQNIALNQIKREWHLLSFAAKWLNEPKMFYADQRNVKNIENDKVLCEKLWVLMDSADIIIGQNIKAFDVKKINARFLHHGMKPPSSYKMIDTLTIAKKNFAFTSNKLAFMSNAFNKKYKKLDHSKFSGFSLWSECLKGNKKAFIEMEKYNKYDVLSTEELYKTLAPWDKSAPNLDVYHDENINVCSSCGSKKFRTASVFSYTSTTKRKLIVCVDCGKSKVVGPNLLSNEKRDSLKK
jgi:DNA polymerase elongation subunit (family B)